ncbi:MAG: ATP-binding protein, partial [Chryseolinea sp.]
KLNMMPVAAGLEISVTTSLQPLSLLANRTLIEILVSNLMSNAIRHCDKEGTVRIKSRKCVLGFANTGPPMKMEKGKMFNRFAKDSSNPESSGLGLAIVYKICENCAFNLQCSYEGEEHVFTVSFQAC